MCDALGGDFGVHINGDTSNVNFTVVAGNGDQDGEINVYVDWDTTSNNGREPL